MKSKRFIRYGVIILTAAIILLGALSVISGDFPLFHFANSNWIDDFSYTRDEIHPLKFDTSGCPTIPVKFGEKSAELIFDTGCSTGLDVMTPLEDMIDYTVLGKSESINRDGSHRGWSYKIRIPEFSVFGNTFLDVETHLSDWQMVASSPFNGLIGLNYFQSKIITLDYENEKIAVTDRDIDLEKLDKKYAVIPLYHTSTLNRDALLFFEGKVNGESRMIYLDRKEITLIRPLIYTEEKLVRATVRDLGLKPVGSGCPVDGGTKRQTVKELITGLTKENRHIKANLFGSIQRAGLCGWKEPKRDR